MSVLHSTEPNGSERLVVKPKTACLMLDVGITKLYELLEAGELESFKDGAARKITTQSIREYVRRQLERARAAA